MKRTALLAMVLGFAGFGAARLLPPHPPKSPSPGADNAAKSVPKDTLAGTAGNTEKTATDEAALPAGPRPSRDEVLGAVEGERLEVMLRWSATATSEEVAEMAEGLENNKLLSQYPSLWIALAGRWAEVDPEAALVFARRLSAVSLEGRGVRLSRGVMMRIHSLEVYKTLLKLDPELALLKLTEEPPEILSQLLPQLRGHVEKSRRESWAVANASLPEAALWGAKAEAEAQSAQTYNYTDLHSFRPEAKAIKDLIDAKDLAGSRAKIDAMPLTYQRAMLELDYVVALATQKSPQEAADWAITNLKDLAKAQAVVLAARELSKTDPAKALAMLRENKIPDLGTTLVGMVEIRTQGSSTSGYRRKGDMDALKDVVSAAAKSDPKAAMDYLLSSGGVLPRDLQMRYVDNNDTTNNGSMGRSIYREWVASDPRAAASWLAAQPSSKGLSEMLPLVAGPLSAQNGAEGRVFVLSLPEGQVRQELIGYAAAEWAVATPDELGGAEALQWAASAGGAAALSAAFQELTRKNAEVASQNFDLLPPETQADRLQSLTDALGKQKPQALPELYAGLPEEMRTEVNLRDALTSLAKQNVEQASAWLNEIPSGKARDTGISGLVDYLIKAPQPDHEAAAHWAAASADPDAQSRRLQRVAEAWQTQNPAGAAAAIQSSRLAQPVRQMLLGYLKAPKAGN